MGKYVITPFKIAGRMRECLKDADIWSAHCKMDKLTLEVLTALGYEDAAPIFGDAYNLLSPSEKAKLKVFMEMYMDDPCIIVACLTEG